MDSIFSIDSLDEFENVASIILNNLYYSSCESISQMEGKSVEAAKQEIKQILGDNQFDLNKITEVMSNRTWAQDKMKIFLQLLQQKKSALLYSELNNRISMYGETVTGFDWLLKIVLGSSDLKTLRYPLVQLILSTVNCQTEQKQLIFDMCNNNILKMINLLEKCTD